MDFVVGVDGGGTHTRVALVRCDGTLLGEGRGGPGNLQDVGVERFTRNLRAAWTDAWENASCAPRPARAAFLGLASVTTAAEAAVVRDVARALGLADVVDVDHDLRVAHAGALAAEPGIVLVVGTGSSCYGRNAAGETWRAGGWGWLLDDVGSASDLGRRAMVAAVRAHDGRGAPTLLSAAVLRALDLREVGELPGHLAQRMSRADVAALAPLVTEAARARDEVACGLLAGGAAELAACVVTVAERLSLTDARIAIVGSVAHADAYRDPLHAAIRGVLPAARTVEALLPPVRGAALLALASCAALTSDVRARLLARG